jgi:hypothetical protein
MTTTNENQAATTMTEEELRQTAFGLCSGSALTICRAGAGATSQSMATMEPGSEALPTFDLEDEDIAAMCRTCLSYLADHGDVDAIRHDAISISITGERRAKLRHLVGVWQWAECMWPRTSER